MVRIQPGHYGASRTCCCLLPLLRRAHSFPCGSLHTVIDDSMRMFMVYRQHRSWITTAGMSVFSPRCPYPEDYPQLRHITV